MRLPGINEDVELVTSFDQLREGVIIWTVPCTGCRQNKRSILTRQINGGVIDGRTGELSDTIYWQTLPAHICAEYTVPWAIARSSVEQGKIYVVVKSIADSTVTTTSQKKSVRA